MLVIGITGGLGSGKTTVARMFARLGARVLDADKIAHRLLVSRRGCFHQIVKNFGPRVLTAGRIDRKKLAAAVFGHPRDLQTLERIVHPRVIREMKDRIRAYKKGRKVRCVVADVPLLFESGMEEMMDVVVVVKARRDQQITRTIRRLSLSRHDILLRLKRQMPMKEKLRRADVIIDNRATLVRTRAQVRQVWQRLVLRQRG